MNTFALVVLITAAAGVVGTGVGGLIGAVLNRDSEKAVSLLLSFAAGVMLCVVCLDLLLDALEQNEGSVGHVFLVIGMVIVGYVVVYFLNYLIDRKTNPEVKHIDKTHPKTADALGELIHSDHYEEHLKEYESADKLDASADMTEKKRKSKRELFVAGMVMAFAIALHNLPEGMVIGASFAKDLANTSFRDGLTMALVIGLHNIPEGMSVSVPLIAGGMKKPKSVFITAATGLPTVLGAMLGFCLGSISPLALSLSLAFASGAMLYVVFGELLPEAILMWRSKAPGFAMLAGLIVGVIILFV